MNTSIRKIYILTIFLFSTLTLFYISSYIHLQRPNLKCQTFKPKPFRVIQKGDFYVLMNYIKANTNFGYHESITYSTHADFTYLENLEQLVNRWRGPVSVAIYAPGVDFNRTIERIVYLRECTNALVKEFVTFHLYFESKYLPDKIPKRKELLEISKRFICHEPITNETYRKRNNLTYPVNVGRNIAREASETYYILASDIELYPSPNLIPQFLSMISENRHFLLNTTWLKVFPIPLFEVSADSRVPEDKTTLVAMLRNGTAVPFHEKICYWCHVMPKLEQWKNSIESKGLHVFHVAKRKGWFAHWEPIFIGTHSDPLYDERLSWEGLRDKMTQGYAFCVLDYDLLILDNAFLVHKPGIKVHKRDSGRDALAAKTNRLINEIIFPELKVIYGSRKGCYV